MTRLVNQHMVPESRDHYAVLGLRVDASLQQIKFAYKHAALTYHPDKPGGSTANFQRVASAFATLSDPDRKSYYDRELISPVRATDAHEQLVCVDDAFAIWEKFSGCRSVASSAFQDDAVCSGSLVILQGLTGSEAAALNGQVAECLEFNVGRTRWNVRVLNTQKLIAVSVDKLVPFPQHQQQPVPVQPGFPPSAVMQHQLGQTQPGFLPGLQMETQHQLGQTQPGFLPGQQMEMQQHQLGQTQPGFLPGQQMEMQQHQRGQTQPGFPPGHPGQPFPVQRLFPVQQPFPVQPGFPHSPSPAVMQHQPGQAQQYIPAGYPIPPMSARGAHPHQQAVHIGLQPGHFAPMGNCLQGLASARPRLAVPVGPQQQKVANAAPMGLRQQKVDKERAYAEAAKVADEFFKARDRFFRYRRNVVVPFLRELDAAYTKHWAGVNTAKTATAGLSIASFILLFFPPTIPVAIGLGIGAAATGGGTAVGDYVADGVKDGHLNDILQKDKENQQAFLQEAQRVQSLTQHMTKRETIEFWGLVAAGAALKSGWNIGTGIADLVAIGRITGQLASAAGDGAKAGAAIASAGAVGVRVAASTTTKVLGGIGMAFAVADCVHSWGTGKAGQERLRQALRTIEQELTEHDQHQVHAADGPQCHQVQAVDGPQA